MNKKELINKSGKNGLISLVVMDNVDNPIKINQINIKKLDLTPNSTESGIEKNNILLMLMNSLEDEVDSKDNEPVPTIKVRLNGHVMDAIIDTGCNCYCLTADICQQLGLKIVHEQLIVTQTISKSQTLGTVMILLEIGYIKRRIKFYVIEGQNRILIGSPAISHFKLQINPNHEVKQILPPITIQPGASIMSIIKKSQLNKKSKSITFSRDNPHQITKIHHHHSLDNKIQQQSSHSESKIDQQMADIIADSVLLNNDKSKESIKSAKKNLIDNQLTHPWKFKSHYKIKLPAFIKQSSIEKTNSKKTNTNRNVHSTSMARLISMQYHLKNLKKKSSSSSSFNQDYPNQNSKNYRQRNSLKRIIKQKNKHC